MPSQEQLLIELNQNLKELSQLIKKQNSLGHGLLLGLLRGFGGFVGSIVITGAILYLVTRLLQSSEFQMQFQQMMQNFVESTVNTTFKNMGLPR